MAKKRHGVEDIKKFVEMCKEGKSFQEIKAALDIKNKQAFKNLLCDAMVANKEVYIVPGLDAISRKEQKKVGSNNIIISKTVYESAGFKAGDPIKVIPGSKIITIELMEKAEEVS